MPYIKQNDRDALNKMPLCAITPASGGELQWIIAELIHAFITEKGLNYQHCQDMMGALAGAQAEFYREVVAPYEDVKKRENGPVYNHVSEYSAPNKSLTKQTY